MLNIETGTIFIYMANMPTLMHVCAMIDSGVGGIDLQPHAISDIERAKYLAEDRANGFDIQTTKFEDVVTVTSFPPHWNREEWLAIFASATEAALREMGVL